MTQDEARMIEFITPGWRLPTIIEVDLSFSFVQCWHKDDPHKGVAFLMLVKEIE